MFRCFCSWWKRCRVTCFNKLFFIHTRFKNSFFYKKNLKNSFGKKHLISPPHKRAYKLFLFLMYTFYKRSVKKPIITPPPLFFFYFVGQKRSLKICTINSNTYFRNSIGPVIALWALYQTASVENNDPPSPLIIGKSSSIFILFFHVFLFFSAFFPNKHFFKQKTQ